MARFLKTGKYPFTCDGCQVRFDPGQPVYLGDGNKGKWCPKCVPPEVRAGAEQEEAAFRAALDEKKTKAGKDSWVECPRCKAGLRLSEVKPSAGAER